MAHLIYLCLVAALKGAAIGLAAGICLAAVVMGLGIGALGVAILWRARHWY